jgi:hypothetical protein
LFGVFFYQYLIWIPPPPPLTWLIDTLHLPWFHTIYLILTWKGTILRFVIWRYVPKWPSSIYSFPFLVINFIFGDKLLILNFFLTIYFFNHVPYSFTNVLPFTIIWIALMWHYWCWIISFSLSLIWYIHVYSTNWKLIVYKIRPMSHSKQMFTHFDLSSLYFTFFHIYHIYM